MTQNKSIAFFDEQFRTQPKDLSLQLNPFETLALPYLTGDVLDFGCGMGNLAFAAARKGCRVFALDGSDAAIRHIAARAQAEGAAVTAACADLRHYLLTEEYDCVVSIGLLMFFDCPTAFRVLADLQAHVRHGGVAIINVLTDGTDYMAMFDPAGHCLFDAAKLEQCFSGWKIETIEHREFAAPGNTVKRFCTLIARRAGLT